MTDFNAIQASIWHIKFELFIPSISVVNLHLLIISIYTYIDIQYGSTVWDSAPIIVVQSVNEITDPIQKHIRYQDDHSSPLVWTVN